MQLTTNKTFKSKLLILILSTTLLSVLVVALSLTYINIKNHHQNFKASTAEKVRMLSFSLVPFILFSDSDSATELLSSFQISEDIKSAHVYSLEEGSDTPTLLAQYATETANTSDYSDQYNDNSHQVNEYISPQWQGEEWVLSQAIEFDDKTIGYIHIHSQQSNLALIWRQSIAISSIIALTSLILSMILALRFQSLLLKPLTNLIDTTQKIRKQKNYAIRAPQMQESEFSNLAENFNHMLCEIQAHDLKQQESESQVRELNAQLESKVLKRTFQLEQSNTDLQDAIVKLKDSQKKLVEQETMASLGQLVAGVAHEVNTPIGISVTASTHLSDLNEKLSNEFNDKKLSSSGLKNYIKQSSEAVDIIDKSLNKAADLISSFKQVAVDQSTDSIRNISLDQYLQEILTTLKPEIKRTEHQFHIDCPQEQVKCNAGALYQIMTNLIINSFRHGFDDISQGNITIKIYINDNKVFLDYSDDGLGLTEGQLKSLFEPFFTTKRNQGGTGLGTHIIYNLVTQALNGQINVNSQPNEGLHYKINFPIAA